MDIPTTLSTIAAVLFLLFLPGFVVSLLFFDFGKIDAIERLALSIGLSLAVLPLAVFYLNLAGVPITREYVALTNITIIIFAALGYLVKKKKKKT